MSPVSFVLAGLWLGLGDVPDPRPSGRYVSAPTSLVAADKAARLDAESAGLAKDLGVEVVLVALAACPDPVSAAELRDRWRVGDRHGDRALVVLACAAERRVEMATGRGLSARLPVGWLDGVQREHLLPLVHKRDVSGALEVALTLVERRLRQEPAGAEDDGPPQAVAVRPRLEVSALDMALGVLLGALPLVLAGQAIRQRMRSRRKQPTGTRAGPSAR